jgi:hypothetical protein
VADEEILQDLQDLGYTPETVMLLHLVPLVQMAWAEGGVSDSERALIVEAARARGVEAGSPADRQLAEWLTSRPSERLFERTLRAIRFLEARLRPSAGRPGAAADPPPSRRPRWRAGLRRGLRGGTHAAGTPQRRAQASHGPASSRRCRRRGRGPTLAAPAHCVEQQPDASATPRCQARTAAIRRVSAPALADHGGSPHRARSGLTRTTANADLPRAQPAVCRRREAWLGNRPHGHTANPERVPPIWVGDHLQFSGTARMAGAAL